MPINGALIRANRRGTVAAGARAASAMYQRAAANVAGRAVRGAVNYLKRKASSSKGTPAKKQKSMENKRATPLAVNTKVKVRHRKTKPIHPSKVRGVSRKLRVKIEKVINHKGAYGEYIYFGNRQLRQGVIDKIGLFGQDETNTRFVLDDYNSVIDAASVLFNQKAIDANFETTTGNILTSIPVTVVSSSLQFYFRSTSNHCVNIEVFECTYKTNSKADALEHANDSMNDYVIENKELYSAKGIATLQDPGIESRHMTSLHNTCYVKTHKIKIEPGEYATLTIRGKSNKVYDGSKMQSTDDTTFLFPKGSKSIFFRVINDITVSGTTSDRIHQFQSSGTGGVAMRYKRTYIIAQPMALGLSNMESKNVVRIQAGYHQRVSETDQQVIESANNFSGAPGAVV